MWRVVTAIALIAGVFGFLYKYQEDNAAWQKVDQSLIALQSALKFESIFQIQDRLTDADAAVRYYDSTWRITPRNRRERAENAVKAILYVGDAVEWSSRSNPSIDVEDLLALSRDQPEVMRYIPRVCSAGELSTSTSTVSGVFILLGSALLQSVIQGSAYLPPHGEFGPVSITKEISQCQGREVERKRAAEKDFWNSFRYHVVVSVSASFHGACFLYIDIDDTGDFDEMFQAGQEDEFNVHNTMSIDSATCSESAIPAEVVGIVVNGKSYLPSWGAHSARIFPID